MRQNINERQLKDSGIPWIGEIPKNWSLERIQSLTSEINVKNNPIQSNDVLSLTIKDGVIPYEEKGDMGNKSKDNHEEYKLAYPDTIVLNSMNILIGAVGLCKYFGCVSPVYYVFKNNEKSDLHYINYIMSSQPFQKYLRKYANGILEIRLRISSKNIMKRHIPTPSLQEQSRIAAYLDEKCAIIDSLIDVQQHMIDKLRGYKQSVITEAVTKGLDKTVLMKDSGVNWIGDIPKEWKISRLGYCSWIRARLGWKGLKSDEYIEKGYLFLSAFNIVNDKLSWHTLNYINKFRYDESPEIKLKIGDILLVKDGAGIGKCARVDELPYGETTANGSLAFITPKSFSYYKYLHYYFISNCFKKYTELLINGMGVPHLTQTEIKKVKLPFPPLSEQQSIAAYLDKKCAEIDALIALKEQKKQKLNDYKQSLIYDCVTGKKEIKA